MRVALQFLEVQAFHPLGTTPRFVADQPSAPFMVELMKEQSATGAHEMFSLFLESTRVNFTINGKSVAGKPFPRDWVGRKSTTAFLAFSEIWINV